jgi:hypothetical protein
MSGNVNLSVVYVRRWVRHGRALIDFDTLLFKFSMVSVGEGGKVDDDFALSHFVASARHPGRAGLHGVRRRVVSAMTGGRDGAWAAAVGPPYVDLFECGSDGGVALRQTAGLILFKLREMTFFLLSYRYKAQINGRHSSHPHVTVVLSLTGHQPRNAGKAWKKPSSL